MALIPLKYLRAAGGRGINQPQQISPSTKPSFSSLQRQTQR